MPPLVAFLLVGLGLGGWIVGGELVLGAWWRVRMPVVPGRPPA